MQFHTLISRWRPPISNTETPALPVLDGSPWVFAAAHANHDEGEEEEEAGHGKTHAVHRLVAHDDFTVYFILKARYGAATYTESWNLQERKKQKNIKTDK